MKKLMGFPLLLLMLLMLVFWLNHPVKAQTSPTPTPPPPPVSGTNAPPPGGGGGGKAPTATATRLTGMPPSGVTPTPLATATTLPTETPTETVTPTPTIPPTLIQLAVFMDANGNNDFDTGEGVTGLLGLARWGDWLTYGYTENGLLFLTIPPEIPSGIEIAVETPYLHWSTQVKAPAQSGLVEAALRLKLPEFPVFLP